MNTQINYSAVSRAVEKYGLKIQRAVAACDMGRVRAAVARFTGCTGFSPEQIPRDGYPVDYFRRKPMRRGLIEERGLDLMIQGGNSIRRAD